MNDDLSTIKTLLSGRYAEQETQRHMSILRPLWDEEYAGRLAPASEIPNASMLLALRDALNDKSVLDWRIMVVSMSSLVAPRHAFMTNRAHNTYEIRYREACFSGLRTSTSTNIVAMLHKTFPQGVLRVSGHALPSDLEYRRYHAVLACMNDQTQPTASEVRTVLLSTYLDLAAHGMESERKRIERLCEIAGKRVIPYGLRRPDSEREQPTFLCIGD